MKTEINCENRTVTVYCGEAPCGESPCGQNTVVNKLPPQNKRAYRPVTDDLVSIWVKSWRRGASFQEIGTRADFSANVVAYNIYKWLFHEQAIRIADLEEQLRITRLDNKRLRDLLKAQ